MTGESSRVVVVTGASSGIGRSAAHQLSAEGARLVLASRSAESLEQVRQECVARGAADVVAVATDVGHGDQVTRLFDTAVERFEQVDAVLHCAAVLAYGRFVDVPSDVFDKTLQTNVTGTANVARSALQQFERQEHGSLVVVGSVLGKIVTPYMSTYCVSKWALQSLVRTLQIETRQQRRIHVSLVTPGGVNTPIYDQAGSYAGHAGHPPPPVNAPETVARAAVAAIDRPGRDIAVGPVNWLMVTGFRALPGVFDGIVGPMMRLVGMQRAPVEATPGNVHEPDAARESVHGRWPHVWG
ncbi:MAG: SDR family NAD(P)-dependent oxidoreductase [Nocardioidaceae bacterium]